MGAKLLFMDSLTPARGSRFVKSDGWIFYSWKSFLQIYLLGRHQMPLLCLYFRFPLYCYFKSIDFYFQEKPLNYQM